MTQRALRHGITLAVALLAMSPLSAIAQTAAEAERAEKLFAEAGVLVAAGKYAEACPKLEESQRLDGGLGTQFNLALCYEKLGKLGSAFRNFRGVARIAHQTRKAGREEAAVQKMDQLRRRTSHLVLTTRDADATLKVDGELVERDTWSFYAVEPGEHTVEASAPAKKSWSAKVVVDNPAANGDGSERQVAVPALAVAAGATKVVTVTEETSNPKRTLGFVIGSVGIVGLGAGLVTGIALLNDRSIADERCQPTCSDQSARDAVATGKTLIPVNVIAWSVGIVGVGVGAVLVLTSKSSTTTTAQVSPMIGPEGGGASVVGRF